MKTRALCVLFAFAGIWLANAGRWGIDKPAMYGVQPVRTGLGAGLVGWWPLNEGTGSPREALSNTPYPFVNSGAWTVQSGVTGVDAHGALGAGFSGTAPTNLKINAPLTIGWYGSFSSTPTANAVIAGMNYTNADSAPYQSYALTVPTPASGLIGLGYNAGGTYTYLVASTAISFNSTPRWIFGVFAPAGTNIYENGKSLSSTGPAVAVINYSANSNFGVGYYPSSPLRNSGSIAYQVAVWNRALDRSEMQQLAAQPWRLARPTLAISQRITVPAGGGGGGGSQPVIMTPIYGWARHPQEHEASE